MNGNVPDEVEEKNKKKKLSRAPLHAAPGVGETVSLRVAAIELAQRSPKKGVKIADGRLLTELKRGAIDAGFHYPSQPVVWVPIPSTYWLEISQVIFRKIRINSKKKTWKGIYKVSLGEFAKQYFAALVPAAVSQGVKTDQAWIISTFDEALGCVDDTFEVQFSRPSWEAFLEKSGLTELLEPPRKKGPGRAEMESWKTVNMVLAAYLIANQIERPNQKPNLTIADAVLKESLVLKEGKVTLPKPEAVAKEITDMFDLVKRLRGDFSLRSLKVIDALPLTDSSSAANCAMIQVAGNFRTSVFLVTKTRIRVCEAIGSIHSFIPYKNPR